MLERVPGTLSDHLLDVLGYTAGIRKLLEHPVDPAQVEHELARIERCVAYVLNGIAETVCSPGSP